MLASTQPAAPKPGGNPRQSPAQGTLQSGACPALVHEGAVLWGVGSGVGGAGGVGGVGGPGGLGGPGLGGGPGPGGPEGFPRASAMVFIIW